MATNLAIDDRLIEEAKLVGKHRTKKGAVTEALIEYIQRRKQSEILQIFHSIEYDQDYDYKKQRAVK
ncbi:MAG: type II toxin-antitoxin system VapB family antitoxin [Bacteroidales bacterium]